MSGLVWIGIAAALYYIGARIWDYNMRLPEGYAVEVYGDDGFEKVRLAMPDGRRLSIGHVSVYGFPSLGRQATRAAHRHHALARRNKVPA